MGKTIENGFIFLEKASYLLSDVNESGNKTIKADKKQKKLNVSQSLRKDKLNIETIIKSNQNPLYCNKKEIKETQIKQEELIIKVEDLFELPPRIKGLIIIKLNLLI